MREDGKDKKMIMKEDKMKQERREKDKRRHERKGTDGKERVL